jgi:D-beta-D-heptose 7-phosphate kinase/D-beta-D-heptose 1-phosphate adenosyltransferase
MKTVVVVGDVMVDGYTMIIATRKSPEANCPCFLIGDSGAMLGGAANVAANVVSLGAEAILVSATGDDPIGAMCAQMVNTIKGIRPALLVMPRHVTTFKNRYVADNGQHVIRLDHEKAVAFTHEQHDAMVGKVAEVISLDADAVVISDYGKGVVTARIAKAAIAEALKRGIPVVVDAKDPSMPQYRGATVAKPNLTELAAALPAFTPPGTDAEAAHVASRLREVTGHDYVLLTRGPRGMCLVGLGLTEHIPPILVDAVDVTGAGDTAAAALAVMLAERRTVIEAAYFANRAAAVAVTKRYTATITQEEALAIVGYRRGRVDGVGTLEADRPEGRIH